MINVLISAYAVSPTWGSEPGMGWNWIINIAKYCNVFVITEGEWKEDILEAIKNLPQRDNIHFYFNPVSEKVRQMCWNQGDWRFYWYYRKWQKKTLKIAEEIIATNHIDILHQLNMIGFREPGYLWKIKDIPIIWGPIGGMNTQRPEFLYGFKLGEKIKLRIKNAVSYLQVRYHPRVKRMLKDAYVIGAVKSVYDKVYRYYGKEVAIINETGTYIVNDTTGIDRPIRAKDDPLKVLWVGRLIPTKRLDIALKAIKETHNIRILLTVCCVGTDKEFEFYKKNDFYSWYRRPSQLAWQSKA